MNSHFIELPSGTVFYRKWGEGKQLLIGLHGFETDSRCFQPLSAYLLPHQRLVAPDLPGTAKRSGMIRSFLPPI
ncbi:MAG: hypothetical protein IPN20_01015 [Haliscomenobacter sp.]|nr:hypothetical protein [Haliscomenobacter sp.]